MKTYSNRCEFHILMLFSKPGNENIDSLTGKCTFLETEEGLDVAWERKILIFLQEKEHF